MDEKERLYYLEQAEAEKGEKKYCTDSEESYFGLFKFRTRKMERDDGGEQRWRGEMIGRIMCVGVK